MGASLIATLKSFDDCAAVVNRRSAMSGYFIALEGPEGAGKSTQVKRLAHSLESAGFTVILTREPGGTEIGEQVRRVVLDQGNCAMLPETEVLLYAAARAQHVGEVLRPALASGAVVVCDRYVDSTFAYQGGGRMLDMTSLRQIQRYATGGMMPDLRILLDLPVELGLRRRMAEGDEVNRLDVADLEFHHRVRDTFLGLAGSDPQSWAVVDASKPPDEVATAVLDAVMPRLPRQ